MDDALGSRLERLRDALEERRCICEADGLPEEVVAASVEHTRMQELDRMARDW